MGNCYPGRHENLGTPIRAAKRKAGHSQRSFLSPAAGQLAAALHEVEEAHDQEQEQDADADRNHRHRAPGLTRLLLLRCWGEKGALVKPQKIWVDLVLS